MISYCTIVLPGCYYKSYKYKTGGTIVLPSSTIVLPSSTIVLPSGSTIVLPSGTIVLPLETDSSFPLIRYT